MRRQYFTHPRYQLSFIFAFVAGFLMIIGVLGGMAIFTLTLFSHDPALTEFQQTIISQGISHLYHFTFIGGGIGLILSTVGGFFLSHKFIGPLNRLEFWLGQWKSEIPPEPLILRPLDELEPLARLLNEILISKKTTPNG